MMVARPSKVLRTPPGSRGTSPSKVANGRPIGSRGTSPSRVPNGIPAARRSPAQSPANTRRDLIKTTKSKKNTPGNSPNRTLELSQERHLVQSRGSSPLTVREDLPKSRGSE